MLAGNLAYAACQWGTLIVLAKAVSPAMVGQFGLGLAISMPVLTFTNLQLRSIQAAQVTDAFEFGDYLGFRLFSSGVGLLAIIGIAAGSGYKGNTASVVVMVALAKCIESIADTVYGHFQRFERMARIAVSMTAKGVLSLAAMGTVVFITRSVLWGVFALGLAWLVVLIGYDLRGAGQAVSFGGSLQKRATGALARSVLTPRWRWNTLGNIARLGLPLGVTSLLMALSSNIPRYLLERTHGEAALGYFAALVHPTAAFSILISALGQAATPRMAEYYVRDKRAFIWLVAKLAGVSVLIVSSVFLVVVATGPSILKYLYRPDYARYFGVFLLLMVGAALWSLASILGFAATASRRLAGQVPASISICVVAIIATYLTVPSQGLQGAAFVAIAAATTGIISYGALFVVSRR